MRMSHTERPQRWQRRAEAPRAGGRPSARRQRGQSLVVAVIVMFVLLFVGGIFVGLVARNLLNTGRTRESVSALQLAEAGITFCDNFLQYSPEGADWRPAPPDPATVNANDPDRRWLLDGFTRIIVGGGRALVRVTMRPDPRVPLGRYIRIEAVGRSGVLDPNDPTTFLNTPAPRLRRELVAYKQVGLTDYLRFVTNRFNEARATADFGTPPTGQPLWQQFGGNSVRTFGAPPTWFRAPGAPMRVNSPVHFGHNVVVAVDPNNGESVLVAGAVRSDGTVTGDPTAQAARFNNLATNAANADPTSLPAIVPSDNLNFSTFGGLLRDDGANPDRNGFPRMISYLQPPLISATDPSTSVTRYRELTRDSGRYFTDTGGNTYSTGRIGLGAGVYLDNFASVEPESTLVNGGKSLRSVWLQPGSNADWHGPFYIPRGAFIEFGYQLVQTRDANGTLTGTYAPRPGFRIVRDDHTNRGPLSNLWTEPFTFFIYKPAGNGRPVLKVENEAFRNYLKSALPAGQNSEAGIDAFLPEFDGVIFAEGNIRVRGLLPSKANVAGTNGQYVRGPGSGDWQTCNPPAVSVVSGNNIYVEGSLVRESPDSMIALLAEDYVVVNPTLFVPPVAGDNLAYVSSFQNSQPPYHTEVTSGTDFKFDFMFGDDPNGYTPAQGQGAVNLNLMLRHGTAPGVTYINAFVNEASLQNGQSADYMFNVQGLPPNVYSITNSQQQGNYFEQRLFQIMTEPNGSNYPFIATPGVANRMRIALDPNYTSGQGAQAYLIDHPVVAPMDVRIEAVMYAQDGSFFIIPGYPLNEMQDDTRNQALARAVAQGYNSGQMIRPAGTADAYPFYGEPYDCRITIVGAVSENRTASMADQAAWMQLWGWVPTVYGSTGSSPTSTTPMMVPQQHEFGYDMGATAVDMRTPDERNANIARGLRFIYDPALAAPYAGYDPDNGLPFRYDNYGRALPPVPRLPVCPGFVFYGEVP